MHDLSNWMMYAVLVLLVLLILATATLTWVMWRRLYVREDSHIGRSDGGHITDAAKVLAAMVVMADSVDAMRDQNSAEHGALQRPVHETNLMVRRILSRFGFLVATDPMSDPPAVPPKVPHAPDLP